MALLNGITVMIRDRAKQHINMIVIIIGTQVFLESCKPDIKDLRCESVYEAATEQYKACIVDPNKHSFKTTPPLENHLEITSGELNFDLLSRTPIYLQDEAKNAVIYYTEQPYLIDTGANSTKIYIENEINGELKSFSGSYSTKNYQVEKKDLAIGNMQLKNVNHINIENASRMDVWSGLIGTLGMDIFKANNTVCFDFSGYKISNSCNKNSDVTGKFIYEFSLVWLPVQFDNRLMYALFDTGNAMTTYRSNTCNKTKESVSVDANDILQTSYVEYFTKDITINNHNYTTRILCEYWDKPASALILGSTWIRPNIAELHLNFKTQDFSILNLR